MAELIIRPITAADDAQMAAIVRNALKEAGFAIPGTAYFDKQLDHLSAYYEQIPNAAYWVLSDTTGRVYGGAGVGPYSGATCELQKLYITDTWRGHGDGQRLIDSAIDYAQKHYDQMYLETFTDLLAANHLYAKNGFKQLSGPLPGSEHSACDAWWLRSLASAN
ncbi:GNAT family N-acetyltransferase [Lacticaseibacillus hulanensis]|uniref:GNAT family N-acetyltransferase n=1 Tax=Lacticaseibacillus hulanensis TaxID=2493111 RepID=UPI000FD81174|nr:GNAT family N-acetyltransferase [Lacticaseibacillus hulanensis]